MLGQQRLVLVHGDGAVTDLAAARPGDLAHRLRERHQARAGELVEPARVAVLGQRLHRRIRDVVGVEERLPHAAGGERDLAGQDLVEEEALAEVLVEPAAAQDRPFGARRAHRLLALLRSLFTAPGEQHQPPHAVRHCHAP